MGPFFPQGTDSRDAVLPGLVCPRPLRLAKGRAESGMLVLTPRLFRKRPAIGKLQNKPGRTGGNIRRQGNMAIRGYFNDLINNHTTMIHYKTVIIKFPRLRSNGLTGVHELTPIHRYQRSWAVQSCA